MNIKLLEKLRLGAEIAVGFVAVLALTVSIFSTCEAHRANQIAKRSIEPQIMVIQNRTEGLSGEPMSGTVFCRERIVLFNGGQSTSVVGVRSLVSFGGPLVSLMNYGPTNAYSHPESATDIIINVWAAAPLVTDYFNTKPLYQAALLVNGARLPARVEAHTTTDLFVDVTAKFNKGRPPGMAVFYVLIFPDTDAVGTGRVDLC